jgi:hypothetical protein
MPNDETIPSHPIQSDDEMPDDERTRVSQPVDPEATLVGTDTGEWADLESPPPGEDGGGSGLPFDRRTIIMGCAGLGGLALIALLVFALFLPPLRLLSRLGVGGFQAFSAEETVVSHEDGISVRWLGDGSIRVHLDSIPRQTFLDGEARGYEAALAGIPSFLDMKSPLYLIEARGEGTTQTEIVIPNDSLPYETLDLYRWDEEAGKWVFVPSQIDSGSEIIYTDELPENVAVFQTRAISPLVTTTLEAGQTFDVESGTLLNILFPTGVTVQGDGSLSGALVGGWQAGAGYAIAPVLRLAGGADLSALLADEEMLAAHVEQIQTFVVGDGYNGVALDYGALDPADAEAFNAFVGDLAAALDPYGKLVAVAVTAPTAGADGYDTGGYDWRALGRIADAVIIPAGDRPADLAPGGGASQMLDWATGEISRLKIYPALSSLSAQQTGSSLQLISYNDAVADLGGIAIVGENRRRFPPGTVLDFNLGDDVSNVQPDLTTGAYTFTLGDESRVWIVTANAVRVRLDVVSSYHVGGIVLDDLLAAGNDPGLLTALSEFKAQSASSVPGQLVLQWTVTDRHGVLVYDQVTELGSPMTWEADTLGRHDVVAELVGARTSELGSLQLRVLEEAGSEDQEEQEQEEAPPAVADAGDSQPADEPTPTVEAPPPSTGGAGADGGGLELGGQVPNSIGHADFMSQAGMTWVKFQAKWPYVDSAVASSFVAAGHAAGFKVLLSIPGPSYPTSIDFNGYIEHLRAVAASQPDAIEIWNEMNLDREWPAGQIDPASYVTNMLAPGFNAIKSVSPGTMVITGALAPTGFFGGCTPNGCDDDAYLRGMSAAGAANYANCIGVHHNSGTTSPSARSGHVSGSGHYSWYFLPTLEVASGAFGGALPVCLTEYGYLTPEGYGTLPTNFNWAADNTVAEQAAWLDEGVGLARGLGWVRLVIIWNVGFTTWDSDPQAGYSIVRPDGTCPACVALGS